VFVFQSKKTVYYHGQRGGGSFSEGVMKSREGGEIIWEEWIMLLKGVYGLLSDKGTLLQRDGGTSYRGRGAIYEKASLLATRWEGLWDVRGKIWAKVLLTPRGKLPPY